ncbi:hypothetical protein R1flu_002610 [Riccia fluitans]|uniref:Uncharacterized protein n=1 Tax=Riccia fluitans TaxID=41844 RepID=A0ABD1Y6S4_9MARC
MVGMQDPNIQPIGLLAGRNPNPMQEPSQMLFLQNGQFYQWPSTTLEPNLSTEPLKLLFQGGEVHVQCGQAGIGEDSSPRVFPPQGATEPLREYPLRIIGSPGIALHASAQENALAPPGRPAPLQTLQPSLHLECQPGSANGYPAEVRRVSNIFKVLNADVATLELDGNPATPRKALPTSPEQVKSKVLMSDSKDSSSGEMSEESSSEDEKVESGVADRRTMEEMNSDVAPAPIENQDEVIDGTDENMEESEDDPLTTNEETEGNGMGINGCLSPQLQPPTEAPLIKIIDTEGLILRRLLRVPN